MVVVVVKDCRMLIRDRGDIGNWIPFLSGWIGQSVYWILDSIK